MELDLSTWKAKVAERMQGWRPRMQSAGVNSLYAFLCAATLWPVVEAARAGDWGLLAALGGVSASLGSNLVAKHIQSWKDEADGARRLEAEAARDPALLAELDATTEKLEVFSQARAAVPSSEQAWFTETLRAELARLGNLHRFEAVLLGPGVIVQGPGASAVRYDVHADMIVVADPEQLWQFLGKPSPPKNLRQVTERYLVHLVDRYRYLDFRGMGVSDRVPLRLPLLEMYVPLKARVELPEGETWARQLRLAGRPVSEAEAEAIGQRLSEPRPVLELLRENDGLIILGDPGAGKTTCLKYLALRLALGEGAQLGLGTRLPVLLPLSAYANALAAGDVPLGRFIGEYYRNRGVDLPIRPMLEEALAQGGALLLLDGLDEVRELAQRHLVVQRVLEFFAFHRKQGNKFILTSRVVGYREVRPIAEGLAECTLVDFEDEDITQFVEQWTRALERAARGDTSSAVEEAARERAELLEAVQRNPGVRRLAANPLLLTILALMKRQGVTLPERRVELYQKYVETLLKHWNLARGLDRPTTRDLDTVETLRVLAPLALWMHQTSPGVGLVKREDVTRKLKQIYVKRGMPDAERAARQLLADAREYAGLLLERGPGEYGFIHLTFQEYLAAVAIAQRGQRDVGPVVKMLAEHVGEDAWREVSLLTIGYIGIVQQRDEAAGAVVSELVQRAPAQAGQAVVLAGEAVADAWPGGVTHQCREWVVKALADAVVADGQVQARLRAAAGNALARLNDPRPGVGVDPQTSLPDISWCYVPAGPFVMGSRDDPLAFNDEQPQRTPDIGYDYWIARYPVSVAQFRAFVADPDGYRAAGWWTKAGLKWRGKRTGPSDFGEPFNLPNHPVVGVTWYEAVAFCRWLTERVRESANQRDADALTRRLADCQIRLPSEAEWEKAARGGLEVPAEAVIRTHPVAPGNVARIENLFPRRRYPWGDQPDPNRSNYADTGIGATSAVGCFPGGASPYGAQDLSGNVWEWCATKWQGDYRDYRDDNDLEGDAVRVVRGGGLYNFDRYVRCASRYRDGPYHIYRNQGFRVVVSPP